MTRPSASLSWTSSHQVVKAVDKPRWRMRCTQRCSTNSCRRRSRSISAQVLKAIDSLRLVIILTMWAARRRENARPPALYVHELKAAASPDCAMRFAMPRRRASRSRLASTASTQLTQQRLRMRLARRCSTLAIRSRCRRISYTFSLQVLNAAQAVRLATLSATARALARRRRRSIIWSYQPFMAACRRMNMKRLMSFRIRCLVSTASRVAARQPRMA
mmetsp:Transcript_23347/g.59855  ORF Transcript_23347/g.59855 Transcript_23347/m.59855 type:complete len:218 (+) Transcript_23347:2571-3224(+)